MFVKQKVSSASKLINVTPMLSGKKNVAIFQNNISWMYEYVYVLSRIGGKNKMHYLNIEAH